MLVREVFPHFFSAILAFLSLPIADDEVIWQLVRGLNDVIFGEISIRTQNIYFPTIFDDMSNSSVNKVIVVVCLRRFNTLRKGPVV